MRLNEAQLSALDDTQRYLAGVAKGLIDVTPSDMGAIVFRLLGAFGGTLPGAGGAGLGGFPGLPFQIPQIPGLDPCRFLKCLPSSIDCPDTSTSRIPLQGDDSNDPISVSIRTGIGGLRRALDIVKEKTKDAERLRDDLFAAAAAATGETKKEIQEEADKAQQGVVELKSQSQQLGEAVVTAIVKTWDQK